MKRNRITLLIFIVLALIAGWLVMNRKEGTLKVPLNNFAVTDTAAITKIFMADRKNRRVTLTRRDKGTWLVNGKFIARHDAVNGLLYTMRNVEVKSPVGKNLYNYTMKLMASSAVKTEIYAGDHLVKTYYVGHPTMDNLGTFMYLEGSSVPFITYLPGFNGFLTTRYFVDETEWKDRALFKYDPRSITLVKVENPEKPDLSFEINRQADSTYTVMHNGKPFHFDAGRLREYLTVLQAVYYEKIDHHAELKMRDSIEHTRPFTLLQVKSEASRGLSMKLYRKPVTEGTMTKFNQDNGTPMPYDLDRFYLRIDGDTTWYICQYFHFDPILPDPAVFTQGGPRPKPSSVIH